MTFGSLFAGIGGIDLGLERAGFTPKWQVEIDPWRRNVLAKHWPSVARHADVREAGRHNLESVDLIAGGFPCQDISYAGKGAGIKEGTRSGLWAEFARIVRELRPRYVLVENVPALRSRGLGIVLGDLAESGYDAEWDCIPAAALGAPHRRDRIWIVAHTSAVGPLADSGSLDGERYGVVGDVGGATQEESSEASERQRSGDAAWGGRADVADASIFAEREPHDETDAIADRRKTRALSVGGGWWDVEPGLDRVAHGAANRVDRLRAIGDAVVPQVAEYVGRLILTKEQP